MALIWMCFLTSAGDSPSPPQENANEPNRIPQISNGDVLHEAHSTFSDPVVRVATTDVAGNRIG